MHDVGSLFRISGFLVIRFMLAQIRFAVSAFMRVRPLAYYCVQGYCISAHILMVTTLSAGLWSCRVTPRQPQMQPHDIVDRCFLSFLAYFFLVFFLKPFLPF